MESKVFAIAVFVKPKPIKDGASTTIYKGKTYKGIVFEVNKQKAIDLAIDALYSGFAENLDHLEKSDLVVKSCELFDDFRLKPSNQ